LAKYDAKLDDFLRDPTAVAELRKSNTASWDAVAKVDFTKTRQPELNIKAGIMSALSAGITRLRNTVSASRANPGNMLSGLTPSFAGFPGGSSATISKVYGTTETAQSTGGLSESLKELISAAKGSGGQYNFYVQQLTEDQVRNTVIPVINKVNGLKG